MNAAPSPALSGWIPRAHRPIVAHFLVHHAICAQDAVAYVPQSETQRRVFAEMQASGIVRQSIPGHYWLDLPAYRANIDRRRARAVPVAIVVALLAALLLITLGYRG